MKKIIYGTLILIGILSSCKRSEYEPKLGNPDERLSEQLKAYQASLTGATYGWKAFLITGTKEIYTFTFKFNDQSRVAMATDISPATATVAESSYRLKALQRPTLLFDTYSYLHMLEDPSPNVAGGVAGVGHQSDFEYTFESVTADTIKMQGTFNKSKLLLVRTKTQAETDGTLPQIKEMAKVVNNIRTYFKIINYNGVDYEAKIDPADKLFVLRSATGTEQKTLYYIDNGNTLIFLDPIMIGTTKVTQIPNVTYDGTKFLNSTVDGKPLTVRSAIAPLKLNVTAAQMWYNQMSLNFNGCWVSDKAFHANGVDDFCNFKNVPNYQTLWYAGPAVFGGTSEGMITYTGALGAPYTLSKVPFTVNNGLARFVLGTNAGTFTGTAPIAVAMTAARSLLYGGATVASSQDWYLIPTSDDGKRYDMVRASDAEAWISWRPR